MITFTKVRWKNFLSTGDQWVELSLDEHPTNLVIGKNGSGKSTVIDVLTYCLFGKSFREVNLPQLVNSINNKGMEVEVEFRIGKRDYRVVRARKPNKFEIYIDGVLKPEDASSDDYQEYLEKVILKMNYKAFTQIVILGSSMFTPFMQLKLAERRAVTDDLLDITMFTTMANVLKEYTRTHKERAESVDRKIEVTQTKIEAQEKYIRGLQEKVSDIIDDRKKEIDRLQKEHDGLSEQIPDAMGVVEHWKGKLEGRQKVQDKYDQCREAKRKLKTKLRDLDSSIEYYLHTEVCGECKQQISEDFVKAKVDSKQKKKEEVCEAAEKLESMMSDLVAKLDKYDNYEEEMRFAREEVDRLRQGMATREREISRIEREIGRLQEGDNRDHEKETRELDDLKKALAKHQKTMESLEYYGEVIAEARKLLKDDGIKTKVIRKYLPVINQMINKNLQKMDFHTHITLDENFKETIISRFKDNLSYKSFSEGQKMRVDTAILFTWLEIARMKNTMNTNLLFLDEIFDGSLDQDGIEDFMQMLKDLGNNKNVFVISHRHDQMIDRFDNVIEFEMHKNFSRIKETQ